MIFKLDPSPTKSNRPRGRLSVLMLQCQQPDRVGTEVSEKTCREINEKKMEKMSLSTSFVPQWSYLALGRARGEGVLLWSSHHQP